MRGIWIGITVSISRWILLVSGSASIRDSVQRGDLGPNMHLGARE
ncbi:hypothetical protein [Methylobacterium oxalidis]